MNWRTHAIIGANVVWLSAAIQRIDQATLFLAIAGAGASLLPDIDAVNAKIHHIGGGILGGLRGEGKSHRQGFFHSLMAVAVLFLVSALTVMRFHPLLPLALALGYLSHLLIDGFNPAGVAYLFPLKRRIHLAPRIRALRVNGPVDNLLFFLGILFLVLFVLAVYYPNLTITPSQPIFNVL